MPARLLASFVLGNLDSWYQGINDYMEAVSGSLHSLEAAGLSLSESPKTLLLHRSTMSMCQNIPFLKVGRNWKHGISLWHRRSSHFTQMDASPGQDTYLWNMQMSAKLLRVHKLNTRQCGNNQR
ncbi:CUB domain-containing protein 2 [Platysternon megacephalum]|uniref:CUB domain-containing protein 2 n=1 Tax=Platysternon megacephalum TaxID=55544 RepID=A0A4D9EHH5_9SAUR|nr:CUB domain-containing protein 2 [Platysternon megacephalum]